MTYELVSLELAVLAAVDLFLLIWILRVPRSYLNVLHGSTMPLDRSLTRRTGWFWLGFTIQRGITLVLWPVYSDSF